MFWRNKRKIDFRECLPILDVLRKSLFRFGFENLMTSHAHILLPCQFETFHSRTLVLMKQGRSAWAAIFKYKTSFPLLIVSHVFRCLAKPQIEQGLVYKVLSPDLSRPYNDKVLWSPLKQLKTKQIQVNRNSSPVGCYFYVLIFFASVY